MVGVSYRTIRSWEVEGRFPKQNVLYQKLADALQCDVSYLMSENEAFITEASEQFGNRGARQAQQILEQAAAMFAGGSPIDSGYRGEIHAIISNVSTSSQTIHKDTRVGQLVITPVVIADFVLDLGNERGTGAFGSTGE